jgi:hypothetical protein
MFVLRSLFWLSAVVMLLPPSQDGSEPAPRVNLIHTAYAVRDLLQDVSLLCARNPDACAASRDAIVLFTRKLETGADIVSAGIAVSRGRPDPDIDHGTLTMADLDPVWSVSAQP